MPWEGEKPSGPAGETKVLNILNENPLVAQIIRAQHGDGMDRRGIDLIVRLEESSDNAKLGSIYVQVKSSQREVLKYIEKKGGEEELQKRKFIVLDASKNAVEIRNDFIDGLNNILKARNTNR